MWQYTDTAYRGEASDDGERHPLAEEERSWSGQQLRRRPMPRQRVQCGEYLSRLNPYDDTSDSDINDYMARFRRLGGPTWSGLFNPLVLVYALKWGMAFFGFCSAMTFLFVLYLEFASSGDVEVLGLGAMLSIPFVLYGICHLLIKYSLVPDRNNIIFHRDTGMVEVPKRGRPVEHIPFADFDAFTFLATTAPSGGTRYKLLLSHRYREYGVFDPNGALHDPAAARVEWEFLQQYMDVTQPVPDLPEFEFLRAEDPTTAAWDRERGRPPHLWRDMSAEKFETLCKLNTARKFPWDATREQALEAGWRPSLYGKVTHGEADYEELMEWLVDNGIMDAAQRRAARQAQREAETAGAPAATQTRRS